MGIKGNYFLMDAFLAAMLLMAGLYALSIIPSSQKEIINEDTITKDLLNSLSAVNLTELNDTQVDSWISDGTIERPKNSVLVQAGEFWSQSEIDKANYLLELIFNETFSGDENYGLSVTISSEVLFNRNSTLQSDSSNILTSRRMITGVEKGEAITGNTASAFLRKVREKRTLSFAYFGGFIGQGNLSIFIDDLPADVDSSRIDEITLQLDVGDDFDFYINEDYCDNFVSTTSLMEPETFDATHCNASIISGTNYFNLSFDGSINDSFVAGGYIKLKYRTDEFVSHIDLNTTRHYFPEVNGIINVYDSFSIPGTVESISAHLEYLSDTKTFLSIADKVDIFSSEGNVSKQIIDLDDSYFSSRLDYNALSNNNIPLRLASFNVTKKLANVSNADIILITDFSGSMKKSISDETLQGSSAIDCNDMTSYPNARKTKIAQCVDKQLIDTVFNVSGNRLWHVVMHDDDIKWYDNPEDPDALKGWIDSISQGKEKTCISCALNQAYDILDTYTNESRKVFIVLMTDGLPTHCPNGGCTSTSTDYGNKICEGYCDINGACNIGSVLECTDNSCEDPIEATSWAANRSINDFNATIYSVGFGTVSSCSNANTLLQQIADDGNGTFQASTDISAIQMIYDNISKEILTYVDLQEQIVEIKGDLNPSTLYGNSFIEVNYTSNVPEPKPNEMSITLQSEAFNSCNTSISIYPEFRIVDARVTSYSGTHWADYLNVNNNTVINLSNYYQPYYKIGDPFQIVIPPNYVTDNNSIYVETGDSPTNRTGCSNESTLIYTALFNSSTSRTEVLGIAEGCTWDIEFEDGTNVTEGIPGDYTGPNTCSYTSLGISYNPLDAYDVAAHDILSQLDFDDDGRLFINIDTEDLEIIVTLVSEVPYLWGPAVIQTEVWT